MSCQRQPSNPHPTTGLKRKKKKEEKGSLKSHMSRVFVKITSPASPAENTPRAITSCTDWFPVSLVTRARLRIHRCNTANGSTAKSRNTFFPRPPTPVPLTALTLESRGTCHRRKHTARRVELRGREKEKWKKKGGGKKRRNGAIAG